MVRILFYIAVVIFFVIVLRRSIASEQKRAGAKVIRSRPPSAPSGSFAKAT